MKPDLDLTGRVFYFDSVRTEILEKVDNRYYRCRIPVNKIKLVDIKDMHFMYKYKFIKEEKHD